MEVVTPVLEGVCESLNMYCGFRSKRTVGARREQTQSVPYNAVIVTFT